MASEYADRTNGAHARVYDGSVVFSYAHADLEFGEMQAMTRE